MGKASRDKGARGEREAIKALAHFGLTALRTAPMQAGNQEHYGDIALLDQCGMAMPYLRIEVKRQERPNPDGALTECLSHRSQESLVMYRRNGQQWRVCLTLSDLFMLLRSVDYAAWRGEQA